MLRPRNPCTPPIALLPGDYKKHTLERAGEPGSKRTLTLVSYAPYAPYAPYASSAPLPFLQQHFGIQTSV